MNQVVKVVGRSNSAIIFNRSSLLGYPMKASSVIGRFGRAGTDVPGGEANREDPANAITTLIIDLRAKPEKELKL